MQLRAGRRWRQGLCAHMHSTGSDEVRSALAMLAQPQELFQWCTSGLRRVHCCVRAVNHTWLMSLRASASFPASSSSRAAATQPGAWRGLVEMTLFSSVRARLMSPISASLDTCATQPGQAGCTGSMLGLCRRHSAPCGDDALSVPVHM